MPTGNNSPTEEAAQRIDLPSARKEGILGTWKESRGCEMGIRCLGDKGRRLDCLERIPLPTSSLRLGGQVWAETQGRAWGRPEPWDYLPEYTQFSTTNIFLSNCQIFRRYESGTSREPSISKTGLLGGPLSVIPGLCCSIPTLLSKFLSDRGNHAVEHNQHLIPSVDVEQSNFKWCSWGSTHHWSNNWTLISSIICLLPWWLDTPQHGTFH